MNIKPRLVGLSTALPPYVLHQDDVRRLAARMFDDAFDDLERLLPIYANACIQTRYSCVPLEWYEADHGFAERNHHYIQNAVDLLERAARECLEKAEISVGEVDAIVAVSTSGIATPSLDALVMERLGTRRDVERLPIFGLGCAGGVLGLARAAALSQANPSRKILYLVVELCGLTFRRRDRSKSNFVATALFGDGAAAALLSDTGDGLELGVWGEYTWPDSLDVMGWRVEDDGLAVVFSRNIPALVRERMGSVTEDFLARHELSLGDIDSFVCHPGGAKVLDAMEDIYGLGPGGLVHSRSVLRDYGNMSGATVMFVLQRALGDASAQRYLMTSLGPGFTAGFLTLERA